MSLFLCMSFCFWVGGTLKLNLYVHKGQMPEWVKEQKFGTWSCWVAFSFPPGIVISFKIKERLGLAGTKA